MVERVGDRHPHVRVPEVRERRAVVQVDQRVNDRLRVDDDVDPLDRHAEEVVGLDQLEALVHERGAVDRDAPPHVPCRVGERLLGRDRGELGGRTATEGAAGCGQHETVHVTRPLRADQLVEGGVLGVHRDD